MKYFILFFSILLTVISKGAADDSPATGAMSEAERLRADKVAFYENHFFKILPDTIRDDSVFTQDTFIAVSNILIDTSVSVSLSALSRFYFEPNCGMIIKGSLLAKAYDKAKIVFTSVPAKRRYDTTATDSLWNGILLEKNAELYIDNTEISNASTGVHIKDSTKSFNLQCVDMSKSILIPVMYHNRVVSVSDLGCVSNVDILSDSLLTVKKKAGIALWNGKKLSHPAENVFKIGSCILAAAGTGAAIFGLYSYNKYGSLYTSSNDPSESSPEQVDTYREKAKTGGMFGVAGAIASLIGATGLTVSFVF